MQTWQVQDTALKPKYRVLMFLGICLEYKTTHCTLEIARKRNKDNLHFLFSFSGTLCLPRSLDNRSGHNNCFTRCSELWRDLPCLFLAFVTPCHSKQVPEPAPVSI